ncbi:MAG TPA: sugar phosphate isomerase/epimerase [Candidatus Hydrogenedentes bacterium]|nr:sugar phosphate isomerase/epimerase [Candidatus Hydrogenedentota bacterium]HPG68111.1 sugar phosphate isomerase/epimerase [Candidatus Hydrogenedentota bacterium]
MNAPILTRRTFCRGLVAAAPIAGLVSAAQETFRLRYILASSLYGRLDLAEILPEVRKTGAEYIDIWPEGHANQREQIEAMGLDAFDALLDKHSVRLGMLTHYDLGPFGLGDEMPVAKRFGASIIICGGEGPKGLEGDALKAAVRTFAEEMKSHVAAAEEAGVTIGIENHANNLIESPDSMRWLVEACDSPHLGIALAPYHLPQEPEAIAGLIRDLGGRLAHFYAWQYGMGCHTKLPKEQELLQMPGRGDMDFKPIIAALKAIGYSGWTSIFMHPVPRGIPILPTAGEVTSEINHARDYLEACVKACA